MSNVGISIVESRFLSGSRDANNLPQHSASESLQVADISEPGAAAVVIVGIKASDWNEIHERGRIFEVQCNRCTLISVNLPVFLSRAVQPSRVCPRVLSSSACTALLTERKGHVETCARRVFVKN
jgi:hypothetical protein